MASIVSRKVGKKGKKTTVYYVVYQNAAGKQTWVKGYTDKRETENLAHRLEDEKVKMRRGDIDPRHEQRKLERAKPIDTHIEEYRAALQAKGNSPNHVNYTISDIKLFVAFTGVTHADAITRPMMDRWVLSLTRAGEDSPSTINRRVGSAKAFLKHFHVLGTLSEYVLYKYPKLKTAGHERRKRRPLDTLEQAKLLASDKLPAERADLYRFVLGCGARHSACVEFRAGDADFGAKTLTLIAKDNTHKRRFYVVPMHPQLEPILKRLVDGKARTQAVLTVPPTRDAAKLLRSDCQAVGIDTTHIDFHALRHTFITTLARANVHPNVTMALAGHSTVVQTLKYYTHFKRADERSALGLLAL